MVEGIAGRISKPENCVFGLGIPTSETAYRESMNDTEERFAKQHRTYAAYEGKFIRPYERIMLRMRRLGVQIASDLTLERFGQLFSDPHIHVVILFSHWTGDSIEFHDGFADTAEIVEHIPLGYAGIIDLCVCHPMSLIPVLRAERPDCLIHYISAQATPRFWLYFYWALFQRLRRAKESYLKVLEELITAQIKQRRKHQEEAK